MKIFTLLKIITFDIFTCKSEVDYIDIQEIDLSKYENIGMKILTNLGA
jgi:hypothetical protein